ncbi:MAG: 2-amino-4-hydroxy-6-hydroxymethyldihydropteridine diphosphokinase [Actinobacteria bacterium]|nr:2-amino-4-hydroxy-6-hydroxymethyldihydropteridine diphosphokinase [Actinomycetota bacterium]
MTRAFLGLGTNLGDRVQNLRQGVASLSRPGSGVSVVGVSPVYETEPVGGPEQGPFLNVVVEVDSAIDPRRLLALAMRVEREAGRVRDVRWGPRTLDVDVLWIDGVRLDEPELTVPHPRLWERRFVLAPLAELAPDLVPTERLAAAGGEVRRVGGLEGLDGPWGGGAGEASGDAATAP